MHEYNLASRYNSATDVTLETVLQNMKFSDSTRYAKDVRWSAQQLVYLYPHTVPHIHV